MTRLTEEQLRALIDGCEGVSPGPWEVDTEKSDGMYGSGENHHKGYHTSVLFDAHGERIADALNSDGSVISEEFDEDGCYAWDEVAERNFSHLSRCDPDTIRALATEVRESRERIAYLSDGHVATALTDTKQADEGDKYAQSNLFGAQAARIAELEAEVDRLQEALNIVTGAKAS